jgi:uncharacterized protein (DUF1800 family)
MPKLSCLMRPRLGAVAVTVALTAALTAALPAAALSVDEARHLLTRTGFGAAPHEIARLLPLSRTQAVDALVAGLGDTQALVAPPAFLHEPMGAEVLQRMGDYAPPAMLARGAALRTLKPEEEQALVFSGMQEMAQLRVWWIDQMTSTRSPQAERLALFWHNHFTSKYFDVLVPRLMFDQLQTLRRLGHRDFGALLHAMLRDPAMLVFLDNSVNTREVPNENFARELLELFTLGIGHYTERDIKELARALAGHSIDFAGSWAYKLRPEQMDRGLKTVLGHTGRLGIDEVERILLAHPRTAAFLTEKFWREYVSAQPDAAEVDRLAQVLRSQRYAMRPFLRALWLSEGFWSDANRGQLVKSPIELLVGFARSFGVWQPDGELIDTYAHGLGQQLFEPPNVAGWKGGFDWLTAQSVGMRQTMLERLWGARAVGIGHVQSVAPRDLLVRYSAEHQGGGAVPFAVRVNGEVVHRGQSQWAADTLADALLRPKPTWEVARVPRDKLPREVRDIEVVFEPEKANTALFVNWVQIDGKRLPARLARASYRVSETCAADGGNIPIGMMYCPGALKFDVAQAARSEREATLADRSTPDFNATIEYGTPRLKLAMRPAGRDPQRLRTRAADELRVLPTADAAQLVPAVSAVPPMQAALAALPDAEARLRALTLDPSYNLK